MTTTHRLQRSSFLAGGVSGLPVMAGSIGMVLVIAFADHLTGYGIRLAILYLVPIGWTTWRIGGRVGALVAIGAAAIWLIAFGSSNPYRNSAYFFLEGAVHGVMFLIIVVLLTLLKRALQHSDQRVVTVLESLRLAVCVDDQHSGNLLYANRRYYDDFALSPPPPAESGEVFDPHTGRWYLAQAQRLRWIDGRDARLRVLSEITEERHARDLVSQNREAAHRTARLVALGELATAIAHEISQPLAAIATYSNTSLRLMQNRTDETARIQEAMRKCRDQARRAGAIIQRLREVLRQPTPALAAHDLNEIARTVHAFALVDAERAGVALALSLAPTLSLVRADRLLIEQVALNLARNAIEAVQGLLPDRRRVTIETTGMGSGAGFVVSDLGDGVPPQACERLFDPFVTTKAGGLGLGLSICRSVVEAHGGTIRYDPLPGGGARFSFTLPGAAA
jgi:C4-dicarboxylate-specific signal transduction histidine kinase